MKKPLASSFEPARGFENFPGDTYFRVCCTIIGSESLTTVFGMGTGVSFRIWSPGRTAMGRLKPIAANLLLGKWLAFPSFWPIKAFPRASLLGSESTVMFSIVLIAQYH